MESYATVANPVDAVSFDVAVVEPDPNLRTRLAVELAGAAQFETMEDLIQQLNPNRPVVAVFGPGFASPIGFQHVHRVTSTHSMLGVVFAVYELTTDVLQQALRAGARDAVVIGGEASLHQSVDRVGELLAGATPRVQTPATRTGAPGRLISVFSTKGGVGKTCVAINVAAAMAKRSPDPVVLIDGDLQFGDVSVMLGLPPQNTVLDAAAAVQYGDMELVQTLASKHEATGLLVLPAPLEPMPTEALLPGEMVNICAAFQSIAGHVVVDLPSVFNDYALAVIEASDDVLLVGSMDIPSIKNLKIGMQTLDLQAIAGPKLKLVLNHANAKVKLDVKEIERVLGLAANFAIPDDIAVPISVNAGHPVVVDEPKAPVSRALDCIAESLLGPVETPKKSRWGK
ncbi:MAG: pilus assembly protein CpaE [Actinomycetota bacterium]|nr:pilus assembly protein CpaE [Actinomycetota bacterium]